MTERWRDVVGFVGFYQVSDMGRVRSLDRVIRCKGDLRAKRLVTKNYKGRMLALTPSKRDGYVVVHLTNGEKHRPAGVHVLVAEAFIPNPLNLPEVNHKTLGKAAKSDNRVGNLEWVTSARNVRHSFENGRMPTHGNRPKVLNRSKVHKIRSLYADGEASQLAIAAIFNISQGHVSDIINGKRWTHI